jgi:hypothetical protein
LTRYTRIWVLQEAYYAKRATIYIANWTCDWPIFTATISWLEEFDADIPLKVLGYVNPLPVLERTFDMILHDPDFQTSSPHPLLDMLMETRFCKITLAIDKVYGILGFVCEEVRAMIKVDYGMEAANLFTKLAVLELSKNKLDILYLCTKPPNSSAHLKLIVNNSETDIYFSTTISTIGCPSWVPDWTQECHGTSLLRKSHKSSTAGTSTPKFYIEDKILTIRGRFVDVVEVVELSRPIPAGSKVAVDNPGILKGGEWKRIFGDYLEKSIARSNEWMQSAMEIAMEIAYTEDKTLKEDAYDALWRTFCCNQTKDGQVAPTEFATYFRDFVSVNIGGLEQAYDLYPNEPEAELKARVKTFVESFGLWCIDRRLFCSKAGRFGWGRDQTRSGDVISVFDGGAVPSILRPDGSGHFKIVGDAYVHGIMDGEAMEMGLDDQDIELI